MTWAPPPPAPGYEPWHAPQHPGATPAPPLVKGAGAALTLAILSYVLLPVVGAIAALVLASIAARRLRASGGAFSGDGVILAARVLAVIGLIFVPLAIWAGVAMVQGGAFEDVAEGFEEEFAEGETDAAHLKVGQCFDGREGAHLQSYVWTWPCAEDHEAEVIAIAPLTDDVYPGLAPLKVRAIDLCRREFQTYVGEPWETSALDVLAFYPTSHEWRARANRRVVCAAQDVSGDYLRGSLRAR